jgi:hypothetical protein
MKIPNCDRAIVDIRKLRDYCLSMEHPRGRHKARVFASALGLTVEDAQSLQEKLLEIVCADNAVAGESDDYGQRYALDFVMIWDNNEAVVRSNWIIRTREDFPRLTSCHVV